MEKLSSKRRRPCVSKRENRALNTNRNKMEANNIEDDTHTSPTQPQKIAASASRMVLLPSSCYTRGSRDKSKRVFGPTISNTSSTRVLWLVFGFFFYEKEKKYFEQSSLGGRYFYWGSLENATRSSFLLFFGKTSLTDDDDEYTIPDSREKITKKHHNNRKRKK